MVNGMHHCGNWVSNDVTLFYFKWLSKGVNPYLIVGRHTVSLKICTYTKMPLHPNTRTYHTHPHTTQIPDEFTGEWGAWVSGWVGDLNKNRPGMRIFVSIFHITETSISLHIYYDDGKGVPHCCGRGARGPWTFMKSRCSMRAFLSGFHLKCFLISAFVDVHMTIRGAGEERSWDPPEL